MTTLAAGRRQARERALEILYEADAKACSPADVLAGLVIPPAPYAADLVSGVAEHGSEIDDWILRQSRDWAPERMAAVDRALLRIAIFELIHRPDVPTGAVMAEAVEMAQIFSTDDSARFVNGLLAAVAAQVRPAA
ncbi:MAG: transcription antitermination factor NusB [Acidimicrobiales bacterium]